MRFDVGQNGVDQTVIILHTVSASFFSIRCSSSG
jgi:hypothetical protein